jgi:hypothetical protein
MPPRAKSSPEQETAARRAASDRLWRDWLLAPPTEEELKALTEAGLSHPEGTPPNEADSEGGAGSS